MESARRVCAEARATALESRLLLGEIRVEQSRRRRLGGLVVGAECAAGSRDAREEKLAIDEVDPPSAEGVEGVPDEDGDEVQTARQPASCASARSPKPSGLS